MVEREIVVVVNNANQEVNVIETIDAIQNAGFKGILSE